MTIEAGLAVTILAAIVAGTRWISTAIAKLSTKMDGVHENLTEAKSEAAVLTVRVNEHGERIAKLEAVRARV